MTHLPNTDSQWSEWAQLHTLKSTDIPTGPGAYIVATRAPLNRAAGSDPEGILDIGESNDLRSRVASFIRCAKGERKEGHMAGWRYSYFKFNTLFPFDKLWVRWASTETKEAAYKLEGAVLHDYIDSYKELPPLNYKFNWSGYSP